MAIGPRSAKCYDRIYEVATKYYKELAMIVLPDAKSVLILQLSRLLKGFAKALEEYNKQRLKELKKHRTGHIADRY